MKKKTKLIIFMIIFGLMAFVLLAWLIMPKKQLMAQHISYDVFLEKEAQGEIRAVYFQAEDGKLYGLYQGTVYALDQLPTAYDFVVDDVDKATLFQSVLAKLDQKSENDFGIILQGN